MADEICAHPICREELIALITQTQQDHVTHRGMFAYVGIPIGVISIIISLVVVIVGSNYGSLNQNLMVSKQRNDYQDQRLNLADISDANMRGDLAVIREKIANMDKSLCTISEAIARIEKNGKK